MMMRKRRNRGVVEKHPGSGEIRFIRFGGLKKSKRHLNGKFGMIPETDASFGDKRCRALSEGCKPDSLVLKPENVLAVLAKDIPRGTIFCHNFLTAACCAYHAFENEPFGGNYLDGFGVSDPHKRPPYVHTIQRTACLPPLANPALRMLSEGNFVPTILEQELEPPAGALESVSIIIKVYSLHNENQERGDDQQFQGMLLLVVLDAVTPDLLVEPMKVSMHVEMDECNPALASILSSEEKEALGARVVHHIVRQIGASLPLHLFHIMCTALSPIYERNNMVAEALDLATVIVDVECMVEKIMENDHAILRVGESLEKLGKFEAAASEYEHLVALCEGDSDRFRIIGQTAVAYKRARLFAKSEEYTLWSLRDYIQTSNCFLLQDPTTSGLVNNMIVFYLDMKQATQDGVDVEGAKRAEVLCWIVCTLLYRVGHHQFPGLTPPIVEVVSSMGPVFCKTIRDRCQESSVALQVLQRAFSSPTLEGYRAVLLDCLKDQGEMRRPPKHKRAKACSWCGARTEQLTKLMQCPCRAVSYCNKECQTKHWPEHKQYCTVYQQKHKSKKKKASSKPK